MPAASAPTGSLPAALRAATRATAWGPMDDPVAQDLLNAPGPTVETLTAILATHRFGPQGVPLTPLDGGVGSVVLAAGDRVVRLGRGPSQPRPPVPEMLQPLARGEVNGWRYEVLPRLHTQHVPAHLVHALQNRLARRGYAWTDVGADNVGVDPHDPDQAWVLDPGGVDPLPGTVERPRPMVPTAPAPDDLEGLGEWLDHPAEDLVLTAGWLSSALLAVQVEQARASYPQFPHEASRTRRVLRALRNGEPWRPVYVERGDPSLFVLEGRHRMVAYADLGVTEIPVVYVARPRPSLAPDSPSFAREPAVAPSRRPRLR